MYRIFSPLKTIEQLNNCKAERFDCIMNPYSHYVMAKYLEPYLNLDNREDYYLGTIVPDIRHYVKKPRKTTHFPAKDLPDYFEKYPELRSFITGYLIHIIVDCKKQTAILPLHFRPLFFFLPKYILQLLIELYYIENTKLHGEISTVSNKILDSFGIEPKDVSIFAVNINTFIDSPSIKLGAKIADDLKILKSPILRICKKIAIAFDNSEIKEKIFKNFDEENFRKKTISQVLSELEKLAPQVIK